MRQRWTQRGRVAHLQPGWGRTSTNASIILLYHSVAPARDPDALASIDRSVRVAEELFRIHMEVLAQRFSIVSLDALCSQVRDGFVRSRQACVTFDDGYADNYEHAFPTLTRLGIPATIFLTTGPMENRSSFWCERLAWHLSQRAGGRLSLPAELGGAEVDLRSPEARTQVYDDLVAHLQTLTSSEARDRLLDALGVGQPAHVRPLTWHEAAVMQRAGITFGGHSHTHPSLTALSDAALREEIATSRDLITIRLGRSPRLFAYPFGEVDVRVSGAVAAAGYVGAVTIDEESCSRASHPHLMPRVPVGNWDKETFTARLDRVMNIGFGNRCKSYLKAVLPGSVVATGARLRAAWKDRQERRPWVTFIRGMRGRHD